MAVWGDKSKNNSGTRMCFYAQVRTAALLQQEQQQQLQPCASCSSSVVEDRETQQQDQVTISPNLQHAFFCHIAAASCCCPAFKLPLLLACIA
jgi:hypothetical protein